MKLTGACHLANAQDWLGCSDPPLLPGERVDREQLAEQLASTPADAEDVEAIADLIEDLVGEEK